MEKAPRYGVLGRFSACSTERIEVLSNKIERNHPLRYTPSLPYLEIVMKSEGIIYQKVHMLPRPPPKISHKDNWMCELDSDIAGSSKDTQLIVPKPNIQLSSTGRPVCGQESTKEIEKRTMFDHDTLSQEEHDDVTDSTSTGKLVSGHEPTKRCVLTPKHVENDQTVTERPVLVDQKGGTQH